MTARKTYRDFHGRRVDLKEELSWADPRELVFLGSAIAIEYQCDKKNGGGDGKSTIYRHEFHKDDILATDETGKKLFIFGPKLKVRKAGIID